MDSNFVKRFLKGSISTSFGTVATVAFHFLSISLMTRYVDRAELGIYFLILAIANGAKILASLGLDLTLVQFLAGQAKEKQQNAFSIVIWVKSIALILLTLLMYAFGAWFLPLFDASVVTYRWIIPVIFILMSFRELFFYIMQGLHQFRNYAAIQTFSAFLKFGLILLFNTELSLYGLLLVEIAMLGSSLLIQFVVIPFRSLSTPRMRVDRHTAVEVFRFGFPLYINSLMTYLSDFGGVFIIGFFLNPVSIAAFEVAGKIPQGFSRLFQSFRVVYFPSLSELFAKGNLKDAQKLMNKSLILLAAGAFFLVLGGTLFSYEIILIVFSAEYLDVQLTFALLMLSVCMRLLATTMGYSLVSSGHPGWATRINIMTMTLEFGLSLLFIPIFGYVGAAMSYVVMTFLSQVLGYFYLRKADVLVNLREFAKPYLILITTAGLYFLIGSDNFILRVGLLLLYALLTLLFIGDTRHAVAYAWKLTRNLRVQTKPAA